MQIVEIQLLRHFWELLPSCYRSLNFIFQPDDETSANALNATSPGDVAGPERRTFAIRIGGEHWNFGIHSNELSMSLGATPESTMTILYIVQ